MSSPTADANFAERVPEFYDREMGPVLFESYALEMADRLPVAPGLRVLEIAAGTGRVTRHLINKLPSDGGLMVTDLHPDMLAIAQQKVSDPRIEWEQADALELPFEPESFDVVVCQFGAMFYPDKVLGHKEAFRVLKPGGAYLFSTWCSHSENPWGGMIHAKMAELFPEDPPRFMLKPFSYCATEAIQGDLEEAGFDHIVTEAVKHELFAEDAFRIVKGALLGSPLGGMVVERGGNLDEVAAKIAADFKAEGGDSPYRSTKTALFVSAKKPKNNA